jgi:hypothetical protein
MGEIGDMICMTSCGRAALRLGSKRGRSSVGRRPGPIGKEGLNSYGARSRRGGHG